MQPLRDSPLFIFEKLQSHHDRTSFDCGTPALNDFLTRFARQNADRSVGVTHVAVAKEGEPRICAYYTLLTRTVESELIPRKKLPRGEIGVVLLGRLGVDKEVQGNGLGRICVLRVIRQVVKAAEDIGIYALVLDAKDSKARRLYHHLGFGFETLLDDPNHLYLPVETMRASISE